MSFWRQIPRPIVGLAPMDGVTDASFRFITAKYGAPDVTFTEFVNIQSAFYAPETLIRDLTYSELERPVVAQIYGRSPELFYKVAHVVCELGFDGLDINMGCPSRKVAAAGCGAALIRVPELAQEIIRAARRGIEDWSGGQTLLEAGIDARLVAAIAQANAQRDAKEPARVRRPIPVSVKTRLGYDRNTVEEWIPALLEERPVVVSLHGRTLQQGYKGAADWNAIARAVELAAGSETIIIGNGDAQDLEDAYQRVSFSGVAGVLLGRAVQGNPWIFMGKDYIKNGRPMTPEKSSASMPDLPERFQVMIEHCEIFEKHAGARNFVAMRKHLTWYCRNFRGAAELRSRMTRVTSAREVAECLAGFLSVAVDDIGSHAGLREPSSAHRLLERCSAL